MENNINDTQYIYITIPVEYSDTYKRLSILLVEYGEDALKDCKFTCKERNSNIIDCLNMFNAAIAAYELGKIKLADTIIKYIDAKLIQMYGGHIDITPKPTDLDIISISPEIVKANIENSIQIHITAITTVDRLSIYRNNELIYNTYDANLEYTYTDTFIPEDEGIVIYKAVLYRGTTSTEISSKLIVEPDEVVSIVWNNGSIEPSTINVGGIAILTKGTVTATYASGRTENVTNSAEFVADRGKIQGNAYIAPDTIGEDTISVRYGGKTASSTIQVNVIEQTYTIKLTVIHGTKSPDSDLIVNAGGSGSWTIEPEDGYQLPIGVVGAELIGNMVNVTNVQADNTYIAECQPVEAHLPVYVGAGVDYASAVLISTDEPLTNNMGVTIRTNPNDYLFIKVDKRDIVNNLYLNNGVGEQFNYPIPLEDAIIDGNYKYYRSEKSYKAGRVNYIINKV